MEAMTGQADFCHPQTRVVNADHLNSSDVASAVRYRDKLKLP
jgi:hypothetical protein